MPTVLDTCASRRAVIATLPGVVFLPGLIAACSSSESPTAESKTETSPGTSAPAAKGTLVEESKVPVGSAIIVAGEKPYVVAQPTQGKFVALSAVCTHQGSTVGVDNGLILKCPSHSSQFDAATGAALQGPAAKPLPEVPVTASNGMLTIG